MAAAAQQAGPGAGAGVDPVDGEGDTAEPKRAKGDVVDAEFEEVTEDKS